MKTDSTWIAAIAVAGVLGFAATLPAQAGPSSSGSGKFDVNSIDCNKLDEVNPRFRRIAERKCNEGKPTFKIANANAVDKEPSPTDVYTGADKQSLRSMIMQKWMAKWPQDQVLGVHMTSGNWKRVANWRADAVSVYKKDTSILAASVVVKTDDRVATIFPAYVNKDNQGGGLNVGVATKTREYVVKQMLLANYKP